MKVPYKSLLRGLNSSPSIDEISNTLFQLGHEHEIVNKIFEMEYTPNRGDCLSINGILRELSIFYKTKELPKIFNKKLDSFDFKLNNQIKDQCSNISFLKIKIEDIPIKYNGQLKEYFDESDHKKINFFTDISNYISFETGQPTHCYDSSTIKGDISLEITKDPIKFKTLLGKEILLNGSNAVFKSDNEIINLAGVIGGEKTSCTNNTHEVLLECAYFDPELIIGKSVKYDIQSDAAYKFERGVDPLNHEYVLRRFLQLVSDHTNIISAQLFTEDSNNYKGISIDLDYDNIKKIIGIDIENDKILDYIEKLGFTIKNNSIVAPSYRFDISSKNDIAEEIARVIGYDSIQPESFEIPKGINTKKLDSKISKIKGYLIDKGFYEVINFPFVNQYSNIKLDNSLDSNKNFMRLELKESLIENLLFNERRQKDSIKIFECSDIYDFSNEIKTKKVLGIIASGRMGKDYESFHKKIGAQYFTELLSDYVDKCDINILEINRNKLNTKSKDKIFYYEIEIDKFSDSIIEYQYEHEHELKDEYIQYDPVSEFPSSKRDLSFAIEDSSKLSELVDLILSSKFKILKEVFIFDYFEDKKNDLIKIGFRFIFQSSLKTIIDKEVDGKMTQIINKALSIKSISIPGLK